MMAACYAMDVYCDGEDQCKAIGKPDPLHPGLEMIERYKDEQTGETYGECASILRRRGWTISRRRQMCPYCTGKLTDKAPK